MIRKKIQLNCLIRLFYTPLVLIIFSCGNTEEEKNTISIVDDVSKITCNYTLKEKVYHGDYKCFYNSGELQSSGTYLNGELNGAVEEYYTNGNIKTYSTYKDGIMDGRYKSYYSNGKMYGQVNYSEGKRVGYYENYDSLTNNLLRRVEYLEVPDMERNYAFDDYVNRVWFFVDGDTSMLSKSSTVYSMKNTDDNKGVMIAFHFSNESTEDGEYENFYLVTGDVSENQLLDTMQLTNNKKEFIYIFNENDYKKGKVRGAIIAVDIYGDSNENKMAKRRKLYFSWSIKDGKLNNW